jgi:D-serine deaminase-like pyridoxal phosphate-dependent protein
VTVVSQLIELVEDTPDVVVDIEIVRRNVLRAAALAREAGVSLRPHVKTHKLPQIARLQMDAGAVGIQVAKLGEAEVMAAAGIDDILVGYPIVGTSKLTRLVALAERARISVSLDSLEVAAGIARAVRGAGAEVAVLVEVDTGLRRLGREPGEAAADLAERVSELPGLRFAGVLTHEGHVYALANGPEETGRLTRDAAARLAETAEEVRSRGIAVETVSMGSTAGYRFAARCSGVTEVRPGTYVFNDRSQVARGAATDTDVAAFVVTTVVGRPTPDRVVVDAGSKVLTSDRMAVANAASGFGRVVGHDDWEVSRLSEEHGVVTVPASAQVAIGDRLLLMPNHICPVINLANDVAVVGGGAALDRWTVSARGMVR